MKKKELLRSLEENTKYFDICYWKERRKNPNSPDLDNWIHRKRRRFQELGYGERNGRC
ncbi:MAG: hypothetical protein ACFFB2_08155 [Promethearchaeota archaeon]